MELKPRDLAVIIGFNTHSEWSKEVAIDWLEGFLELHLEEAVMRGECKVLGKGSLTPSHDAKDGKDPLTHLYGELEVDINSP